MANEAMTPEQLEALTQKIGAGAVEKIKSEFAAMEVKAKADLEEKFKAFKEGAIMKAEWEAAKTEALAPLNQKLADIETASKTQGEAIAAMVKKSNANSRSFEDFFEKDFLKSTENIQEIRKSGKVVEITAAQMKAAGTQSISGSIGAMSPSAGTSPYLPGLSGTQLEIFDIARNPNFIINKVDVGRTSVPRVAWINETTVALTDDVASANVTEGSAKPLVEHSFTVEYADAKKAAAYIEVTEEFENDVPALATKVRRMLQEDVLRVFDDQILVDIRNKARVFNITGFNTKVDDANLYDAILAEMTQLATYNFIANGIFMNPVENGRVLMSKDSQGRYLYPPFLDQILPLIGQSNKIALGFGLTGDFSQYKVDIYKDLSIRIGWINDNFINNKFVIVAELRYCSYISEVRRNALVYNNLQYIADQINGTPHS